MTAMVDTGGTDFQQQEQFSRQGRQADLDRVWEPSPIEDMGCDRPNAPVALVSPARMLDIARAASGGVNANADPEGESANEGRLGWITWTCHADPETSPVQETNGISGFIYRTTMVNPGASLLAVTAGAPGERRRTLRLARPNSVLDARVLTT